MDDQFLDELEGAGDVLLEHFTPFDGDDPRFHFVTELNYAATESFPVDVQAGGFGIDCQGRLVVFDKGDEPVEVIFPLDHVDGDGLTCDCDVM